MTTEEGCEERIAKLREMATQEWKKVIEASATHYDLHAEADRLRGDDLSAEFHASLAACYRNEPGAQERKDRAYVRLQASRCLDGNFVGVEEKDLPAVRAEVERLRSESASGAQGEAG